MNYLEMQKTEIRQAQVAEALHRMKTLKLHENVIKEFRENGKLNLSDMGGILFWLDESEERMVREWERKTDNIVYHVIKSYFSFGLCYSFLYVSPHQDEWEYDKEDIKAGCPLAYVKNVTCEFCSEYGSIGITSQWGGLDRTA